MYYYAMSMSPEASSGMQDGSNELLISLVEFVGTDDGDIDKVSGLGAVGACTLMAFGYVALLYAPALCLPRPKSVREHMLRRFACAAIASLLAPFISVNLLPVQWGSDRAEVFDIFGVTSTHLWQSALIPTLLTATLYLGPLLQDLLDFIHWCIYLVHVSGEWITIPGQMLSSAVVHANAVFSDVLWWRNFLVAPVSEEIVFRACMVPLLLCGGFSPVAAVFICPMFFALAHVHHIWELVHEHQLEIFAALQVVGMQLGYTTLFGWYATFLYLRTGHVLAPLVAHMVCNMMGLPSIDPAATAARKRGLGVAYVAGLIGFVILLVPMTNPALYNETPSDKVCSCWLGYCKWK